MGEISRCDWMVIFGMAKACAWGGQMRLILDTLNMRGCGMEAAISARGWRLGFQLGVVRLQESMYSMPGVKGFHAQPPEERLK